MPTVTPTSEELRELARLRLREAEILFDAELYDGCVYLCGYVVEFALKACICATPSIAAYPGSKPFLTHDFEELKLLAGLRDKITLASGALLNASKRKSASTQSKPIQTVLTYFDGPMVNYANIH